MYVCKMENKHEFTRPKVLVCAPQHESKNYCFVQWLERVRSFTYPNYDIFLADNSETTDNYKYIIDLGVKCEYIKKNDKGLLFTINDAHNACREYAIRHNYDYILHLETDVFPPLDVIERLMNHKRRVCSGLYDIFYGKSRKLMVQIDEQYSRNVRGFRSVRFIEEGEVNFFDGTVKRVYHAGIGCILIERDVFKKIPFRVVAKADYHSDTWFANDCMQNNIPIYVDTMVQCQHYNTTWLSVKGLIN